jgi:hypothetical protein
VEGGHFAQQNDGVVSEGENDGLPRQLLTTHFNATGKTKGENTMTSDAKAMCETFNAAFKLAIEKGKEIGRREAMSEIQETIDRISALIDSIAIENGGNNAGE